MTVITAFDHELLPQRVVFGWGRFAELPAEIERLGATRVIVVAERSMMAHAARAAESLGGRFARTLGPARAHVPAEDARAAHAAARAEGADLAVSIGGGSATGLGKVLALTGIPLLAVPTTYAGSEMTPIYGTTEGGRKTTDRDDAVLPRTVLYDPELTVSLPPRATASTGMNAIAHCVEGLYADRPSPVAAVLAEESIRVLSTALPACVRTPDDAPNRSAALYGAYLAGMVLASAGMAVHHRICHVLGGSFELAHGDANAVVLPHVAAFNEPAAPAALERVARALGADRAPPALFDLARALGAPVSLVDLGLTQADVERAAGLVMESRFYNPRPVGRSDVQGILERAHAGERPE